MEGTHVNATGVTEGVLTRRGIRQETVVPSAAPHPDDV
jgi:hypothetical protein